jgi:hypothetical protein
MKTYDFSPGKLPPDLLQAIGLLVVCSEQTETIVAMFVHHLLGEGDVIGYAVTAELGLSAKLKLVRTLAAERLSDKPFLVRLDRALKAVEKAASPRGTAAHSGYFIDPEKPGEVNRSKITARGKVRHDISSASAVEIAAAADAALQAGLDLVRLLAVCPTPQSGITP